PKYSLFREVIAKDTGATPPAVPAVAPTMKIPEFKAEQAVALWKVLPTPVHSEQLQSMEDLGQAYGYILYRTRLKGASKGNLVLDGLHDYARVYLDGKLVGTLDRRIDQKQLPLDAPAAGTQLDILVENTGRINFNIILRKERKGIVGQVTLDGKPISGKARWHGKQTSGWDIYPLPMDQREKYSFAKNACAGACFYRATFHVDT